LPFIARAKFGQAGSMLLDGANWQRVFFGSERFASWRSYVLPYCAEPCPRALMEFDGEGRKQGREL
jgi:hypothetical protein